MIEISRADLAALVERLAHEHFGYDEHGAAALRAYRGLERAVETGVSAIAIPPGAASGQHDSDKHEG